MPIYQFKCKHEQVIFERHLSISEFSALPPQQCPSCGEALSRVFSFGSKIDFVAHYSSTLGKFVNSKREQTETLRKLEGEHAARLGYQPKYELHDPRDLAYTVTEEGMDATRRHQSKTGQLEVRKWL